jgi:hypothetical protein
MIGSRWMWVVNFTPLPLQLMDNRSLNPLYPYRRTGGPQEPIRTLWRIEKLFVPDGSRVLVLLPCVCALCSLVLLTDPFHGTGWFIARHWTLSWATWIQFTSSHPCLRNIYFNIILPYTPRLPLDILPSWRMSSSRMWRYVDVALTDVSEERIASIFRVEKSASEEPAGSHPRRRHSS